MRISLLYPVRWAMLFIWKITIHSTASLTPQGCLTLNILNMKLCKKSLPTKPVLRKFSKMSGTAMNLLKCLRFTATTKNVSTTPTKTSTTAITTNTTFDISR